MHTHKDWTRPDPRKSRNFWTRPDPTRGSNRPTDNSDTHTPHDGISRAYASHRAAKISVRGHLRASKIAPIAYEFLFVFHCNYGHILHLVSKLQQRHVGYNYAGDYITLGLHLCRYCRAHSPLFKRHIGRNTPIFNTSSST